MEDHLNWPREVWLMIQLPNMTDFALGFYLTLLIVTNVIHIKSSWG